ncbi:DUF6456 domain-containing protein [Lacibacterium aquatile]|uniref:DUF6456 domain-containing protein n=1 Tax=Lacibacterium aquatile TaxID=1168082 RepID=A0ABW5DT50_9PROT
MPKAAVVRLQSFEEKPDYGTPRLRAAGQIVEEEDPAGVPVRHVRVNGEPLDRYLARGELKGRQAEAAKRLRALWYRCHFEAGLTMRWDERVNGSRGSEAESMSDGLVAARRNYAKAVQAVGIRLSDALCRVVCEGMSARDWAVATGRHPASGIEMLRLALDLLADHWGM